jgi:hypothetical protein
MGIGGARKKSGGHRYLFILNHYYFIDAFLEHIIDVVFLSLWLSLQTWRQNTDQSLPERSVQGKNV